MHPASAPNHASAIAHDNRVISSAPERLPALALIPALATGVYYLLPPWLKDVAAIQVVPQLLAYVTFGLWISRNHGIIDRLGLRIHQVPQGMGWGLAVGVTLGLCNSFVILAIVPWLGADIHFLKDTPHAKVPMPLMLPGVILLISVFVELNFRGFQLGRWLALCPKGRLDHGTTTMAALPVTISSLLFAVDPFLVATFRHLHWIAMWDGIIWGTLWLRLRNLYATIVAHAAEVIIMYVIVRNALL